MTEVRGQLLAACTSEARVRIAECAYRTAGAERKRGGPAAAPSFHSCEGCALGEHQAAPQTIQCVLVAPCVGPSPSVWPPSHRSSQAHPQRCLRGGRGVPSERG